MDSLCNDSTTSEEYFEQDCDLDVLAEAEKLLLEAKDVNKEVAGINNGLGNQNINCYFF